MKIIKGAFGAMVGLLAGTVICWGLLYLYGAFVLRGEGSLFDTNPQAANAFFIVWLIVSLLCALIGIKVAFHRATTR